MAMQTLDTGRKIRKEITPQDIATLKDAGLSAE